MQILSVNVGLPREVMWKGRTVTTGIYKSPVSGSVAVHILNLDGDRQADLSVHGGVDKAVYAYPAEHYPYWQNELPDIDLPWGIFGENLTTEGLDEEVAIGDRFRIGTAEVRITQPRMPCYKLGVRFGREDMVKRFLQSGRNGFYFAVEREGAVEAGDRIEVLSRHPNRLRVADVALLYVEKQPDPALLQRATAHDGLPESWRAYFQKRLTQ